MHQSPKSKPSTVLPQVCLATLLTVLLSASGCRVTPAPKQADLTNRPPPEATDTAAPADACVTRATLLAHAGHLVQAKRQAEFCNVARNNSPVLAEIEKALLAEDDSRAETAARARAAWRLLKARSLSWDAGSGHPLGWSGLTESQWGVSSIADSDRPSSYSGQGPYLHVAQVEDRWATTGLAPDGSAVFERGDLRIRVGDGVVSVRDAAGKELWSRKPWNSWDTMVLAKSVLHFSDSGWEQWELASGAMLPQDGPDERGYGATGRMDVVAEHGSAWALVGRWELASSVQKWRAIVSGETKDNPAPRGCEPAFVWSPTDYLARCRGRLQLVDARSGVTRPVPNDSEAWVQLLLTSKRHFAPFGWVVQPFDREENYPHPEGSIFHLETVFIARDGDHLSWQREPILEEAQVTTVSPDGRYIAGFRRTGSGAPFELREAFIWDRKERRFVFEWPSERFDSPPTIAVSPDGNTLGFGSCNTLSALGLSPVRYHEVARAEPQGTSVRHCGQALFYSDSGLVALDEGRLDLWRLGEAPRSTPMPSATYSPEWGPGPTGTQWLPLQGGVWINPETAQVQTFDDMLSHSGGYGVLGRGTTWLQKLGEGRRLWEYTGRGSPRRAVASRDGQYFFVHLGRDRLVKIRARSGESEDVPVTFPPGALQLSHDGQRVLYERHVHHIQSGERIDLPAPHLYMPHRFAFGDRLVVVSGAEHGLYRALDGSWFGQVIPTASGGLFFTPHKTPTPYGGSAPSLGVQEMEVLRRPEHPQCLADGQLVDWALCEEGLHQPGLLQHLLDQLEQLDPR